MADLLTLSEYKALMDVSDNENDTHITSLLPAMSRAIRSYTGRQFDVTTGVATERTFEYDQSGMLDIDDCTSVTAVSTDAGIPSQTYALQDYEWTVMPQDGSDVFYYILIHGGPFGGVSPEMGFKRNLDRYPMQRFKAPLVRVTAVWGWDEIPADVKLAAALSINELVSTDAKDEGLTAEAIADWSRSWGGRGGNAVAALAIPSRARDILANYQRIFV